MHFLVPMFIFGHILVHELILFQIETPWIPMNLVWGWKVIFPMVLAAFVLGKRCRLLEGPAKLYAMWYLIFLCCAGISSNVGNLFDTGLREWAKYLPRLMFFVAVGMLFCRSEGMMMAVQKWVVGWGVLSTFQWIGLMAWVALGYEYERVFEFQVGNKDWEYITFADPFGILGHTASPILFQELGIDMPIFRLCGFWSEPSVSSGFVFASYFVARGLYAATGNLVWRWSGYVCLFGGFGALSNTGYFALGVALIYELAHSVFQRGKMGRVLWLGMAAVVMLLLALWSRSYVHKNLPDSGVARIVSGARQHKMGDEYDPMGGRTEWFLDSLRSLRSRPIGTGMFQAQQGYEGLSPSALGMWITMTGIPGTIVILLRDWCALRAAWRISRRSEALLRYSQAWVCIWAQNFVYGSWTGPLYMVMVAVVVVYATRQEEAAKPDGVPVFGRAQEA